MVWNLWPVIAKILEIIIANRLINWLKAKNFCGDAQYGFMDGKSTITAIIALKRHVEETEHRHVMCLFLDKSGAFDNAWWPFRIHQLMIAGCPDYFVRLLQCYLNDC